MKFKLTQLMAAVTLCAIAAWIVRALGPTHVWTGMLSGMGPVIYLFGGEMPQDPVGKMPFGFFVGGGIGWLVSILVAVSIILGMGKLLHHTITGE